MLWKRFGDTSFGIWLAELYFIRRVKFHKAVMVIEPWTEKKASSIMYFTDVGAVSKSLMKLV